VTTERNYVVVDVCYSYGYDGGRYGLLCIFYTMNPSDKFTVNPMR
jgi:hypothetical protein